MLGSTKGNTAQHQDLGPHGEPLNNARQQTFEKTKYADIILEVITYTTAKLSVIYLYRRIFTFRIFRHITTAALAIVSAWGISFFFVIVFQCTPIASQWNNLEIRNQKNCVAQKPFYYANSITDLILDIFILALPLPMVARLQLPLKQKLAVGGMLLLGVLVCVSSAMRLGVFLKFVPEIPKHINDITYYQAPLGYWSLIEGSLSVVSACLPTLRPLFSPSRRKQISYIHSSSSNTQDSTARKTPDVDEKPSLPKDQGILAPNPKSPLRTLSLAKRREKDGLWRLTPSPTMVGSDNDDESTKALNPPISRYNKKPLNHHRHPPPKTPNTMISEKSIISAVSSFPSPPTSIYHPLLAKQDSRSAGLSPLTTTALQYPRPAPPIPDYVQIREEADGVAPQQVPWYGFPRRGPSVVAASTNRKTVASSPTRNGISRMHNHGHLGKVSTAAAAAATSSSHPPAPRRKSPFRRFTDKRAAPTATTTATAAIEKHRTHQPSSQRTRRRENQQQAWPPARKLDKADAILPPLPPALPRRNPSRVGH